MDSGAPTVQATRSVLEGHLVRRLLAWDNVTFVPGKDIVGLVAGDDGRCAGARVVDRVPGSTSEVVAADLVVDAMGRGSRVRRWLRDTWSTTVPCDELRVGVTYASRPYRLVPELLEGASSVLVGPPPGSPYGMVAIAVEGGRHMVTVAGVGGQRVPDDDDAFTQFIHAVAPVPVAAALDAGEPDGPIATYRFPAVTWHRYERADRLPDGLIAIGDALCGLNPIYAQGMSVAAIEAATLRAALADGVDGVAARYTRAAAAILKDPWQMGIAASLAMPGIEGRRSMAIRVSQTLNRRVEAAAGTDAVVARQFIRVIGMVDPPQTLARPAILARLARSTRARRPGPASASASASAGTAPNGVAPNVRSGNPTDPGVTAP